MNVIAWILHHMSLATKQQWNSVRADTILDIKDHVAVKDGIIMKCRHIIIPDRLQTQTLKQVNSNHRVLKETRLLACGSIYWVNINVDIDNAVKLLYVLIFSRCSLKRGAFITRYWVNHGKSLEQTCSIQ